MGEMINDDFILSSVDLRDPVLPNRTMKSFGKTSLAEMQSHGCLSIDHEGKAHRARLILPPSLYKF